MTKEHSLDEIEAIIKRATADYGPDAAAALRAHAMWALQRRPTQTPPPGDWTVWLLLAGRGFGKTRTAAETLRDWAWEAPRTRWLLSAPTWADIDKTCFNGESGLLAVIPEEMIAKARQDDFTIELTNGSIIQSISAEKPERFRGPQFHGGWCDELAAWQYAEEAWDLMMLGMRLGRHPRIIASTTPKPRPLIRRLVLDKHTVVTYGSTRENLGNLAPTMQRELMKYEGTRYGRQEIEGELIDPEEAGIIKRSWLKLWPATKPLPALTYIIISLDTAFTEKTIDKKTNDPDPTACSVWGLFKDKERWGILLLDCWEDWLGMPDLIRRCKKEMEVRYGDDEMRATIKPAFGSAKPLEMGKTPDLLLIEEKGSGISLRQMLSREGIVTYPYNPGKADKLQRLHAVSHIFAGGYVWVLESKKNPGQPRAWADPLISQLCSFAGEGSVKHDDYVDSTTQAIRYLADAARMSVENPKLPDDDPVPRREVVNPYGV